MNNYDDIIEMTRHISSKHLPMPKKNRAAQFAPFSALSSHRETIIESERLTNEKIVLDEDKLDILNKRINEIKKNIKMKPNVTITYFKEDMRKEGGLYLTIHDSVNKIDEYTYMILLESGEIIKIEDIYDIEIV